MKKLQSLLAIVLAAVLVLGTAVTAMAVTDAPVPTTRLKFDLGITNGGAAPIGLYNNSNAADIKLDGYRLLDVKVTEKENGENEENKDYAYVYSLRKTEGGQDHPLTDIMVAALNQTLGLTGGSSEVGAEDLIENLGSNVLTGDKPAKFAEAVWQGILDYNEGKDETDKITPDHTFALSSTDPSINPSSDIAQGYWLFAENRPNDDGTTSKPSAFLPILLDTLGKESVTVKLKKDAPTIDKEVKDKNGNYGDSNTASIGDTVEFKATSKIPNMTGYQKYFFVVTDTLSKGLDFDANSVTITIGDGTPLDACPTPNDSAHVATHDPENENHSDACDYMVTAIKNADGTTTVKIVFINFIQYAGQYDPGTRITITYSAELTDDAVIGNAGNPNSVKLNYSNDPLDEQEGLPGNPDEPIGPIGETPKSETKTYVTGIQLNKEDEDGNPLADAEFSISGTSVNKVVVTGTVFVKDTSGTYYKLKDGTYTETPPDGTNNGAYEDTTTKYAKEEKAVLSSEDGEGNPVNITAITAITVDGLSVIRFEGLGEGTFEIRETRAPAGFNLLKDPIYVRTVWNNEEKKWTAFRCDVSGNQIEGDKTVQVTNDGTITLTVENRTGTELPSTGGIGTTIFYVAGVLLVLGAGAMLIRKKREETK